MRRAASGKLVDGLGCLGSKSYFSLLIDELYGVKSICFCRGDTTNGGGTSEDGVKIVLSNGACDSRDCLLFVSRGSIELNKGVLDEVIDDVEEEEDKEKDEADEKGIAEDSL